ncbi:DEAD/DEAH box helicase [Agrobacterium sp. MAFF310724]|nr:DEAD/DEAH box helicase [Agrobacterium sp. MAFF310724]
MNKQKTIYTVSAPVGSGKTKSMTNYVANIVQKTNKRVVIAMPTIKLIEQERQDLINSNPHVIHSGSLYGFKSTTSAFKDALLDVSKRIIITTHATLFAGINFAKNGDFELIIDEIFEVEKFYSISLSHHKSILTDNLLMPQFADGEYSRVIPNPEKQSVWSKMIDHQGDEVSKLFSDLFADAKNPAKEVVIKTADAEAFNRRDKKLKTFTATTFLLPEVFKHWSHVTIMGASIPTSMLHHIWQMHGIDFQPHPFIKPKKTAHTAQDGERVEIAFLFDDVWSIGKFQNYATGTETLFTEIGKVLDGHFGSKYLLSVNSDIDTPPYRRKFGHGQIIETISHGLNEFREETNAAFLTALNYSDYQIANLDGIYGFDQAKIHMCRAVEVAYQFFGRTNIRMADSDKQCRFVVADKRTAEAVAGIFQTTNIVKIDHDIVLRPAKVMKERVDDKDRQAKSREITKIEKELSKQIKRTQRLHFGHGQHVKDVSPIAMDDSAKGFFRWLDSKRSFVPAAKSQTPYITPSVTRDDASRRNPNLLVIDIDGTTISPDYALDLIPYTAGIYNTYSCDVGATGVYRYRIYIPMTHEVPIFFAKWIIKHITARLVEIDSSIYVDKLSAKDIFYIPCKPVSGKKEDYFRHVDTSKPVLDPTTLTRKWAKDEHKAQQAQPITAPTLPATTAQTGIKPWQQAIRHHQHEAVIQAGIAKYGNCAKGNGNRNFNAFAQFLVSQSDINVTELSPYLSATHQYFGSDIADRRRQAIALPNDDHILQIIAKRGM